MSTCSSPTCAAGRTTGWRTFCSTARRRSDSGWGCRFSTRFCALCSRHGRLTDGKAFQYMAYYRTALGALPNLLAALALFYLFKGLDLACVRWVNAPAGTTLGVYILHQVPAFRGFLWNGLLQAEAHHGSVGYTLLAILAVFLGCAAVDALRTALVMRPLENTRLFKVLCEKGDALAAKITADD